MDIQIEKVTVTKYATYVNASSEKKSAFIGIDKDGSVQVICKNAAHAAFRGSGRFFANTSEAIEAYKSADMKAMIQAAQETLETV